MKLVSMKVPKKKKKDLMVEYSPDDDQYPYGLKISLEKEQLEQLGIKDLPKTGTVFNLMAECEVCSVSEHATKSGDMKSMSLQITSMALHGGGDEEIY